MFEKAIAKYKIDINASWMIGDRGRDIIPARQLGIRTIQIGDEVPESELADYKVESLLEAARLILKIRSDSPFSTKTRSHKECLL